MAGDITTWGVAPPPACATATRQVTSLLGKHKARWNQKPQSLNHFEHFASALSCKYLQPSLIMKAYSAFHLRNKPVTLISGSIETKKRF
jgi:hypothetical protein